MVGERTLKTDHLGSSLGQKKERGKRVSDLAERSPVPNVLAWGSMMVGTPYGANDRAIVKHPPSKTPKDNSNPTNKIKNITMHLFSTHLRLHSHLETPLKDKLPSFTPPQKHSHNPQNPQQKLRKSPSYKHTKQNAPPSIPRSHPILPARV